MTYRSFSRVFTNNSKYRSFDKIPYFDSLAHTVEEVLYKRSFKGCDYCFFLDRIQLFDFMTLVAYFISASSEDFARATIKGYLTEMKHYKSGNQYDTQVEYTAEGGLLVTNAKEELITDLLWATHLYATFRFELSSNNDFWKNTMDMLYEMMIEESDWESELAKTDRDSYLEANKVAMKILIEHWLKNKDTDVKEQKTEDPKDIDSKRTSQPQACIAELEAELEKAKADIEAYEQQGKGVSAAKHALLLTTLCQHLGGLPQNGRQSLSYILQKLYGYTESTAEKALKQKVTQRDANALAKLFHGISPRVENLIAGMPKLLEELNNERLRKLNEQKKKKK